MDDPDIDLNYDQDALAETVTTLRAIVFTCGALVLLCALFAIRLLLALR